VLVYLMLDVRNLCSQVFDAVIIRRKMLISTLHIHQVRALILTAASRR
jgi:hypothetical protein